jgi:predicted MPP superfamily phosphohydrolase
MDVKQPKRLLTRRNALLALGGGFLAGTGVLGWTLGFEPHWFEVVHNPLRLKGLPASLEGKRLVQLTDFHLGSCDLGYLITACQRVNELKPDLIALTGDFVDCQHPQSLPDTAKMLDALAPAPLGRFAVLGNHDYGTGWRDVKVADRVVSILRSKDIRVLSGEIIDIEGLQLVGLDDLWSPRFEGWRTLANVDLTRDALCLCHNPDACDLDFWQSFRGTTLSGHTHGGQCKPPFFPPPLLPVKNRSYVAGFYQPAEHRQLYISRGIGHSLRARFNCRPEISVFTLQAA